MCDSAGRRGAEINARALTRGARELFEDLPPRRWVRPRSCLVYQKIPECAVADAYVG